MPHTFPMFVLEHIPEDKSTRQPCKNNWLAAGFEKWTRECSKCAESKKKGVILGGLVRQSGRCTSVKAHRRVLTRGAISEKVRSAKKPECQELKRKGADEERKKDSGGQMST